MRKCIVIVSLAVLLAFQSLAQSNQTKKEVSQREQELEYQKELKLDKIPAGAIKLKLISVMPSDKEIEENEIYFRNVGNFFMDDRGYIYIPDGVLCVVYVLDVEGNLASKYDKKGHGPGDFQFPSSVHFVNKQVIVIDGLRNENELF